MPSQQARRNWSHGAATHPQEGASRAEHAERHSVMRSERTPGESGSDNRVAPGRHQRRRDGTCLPCRADVLSMRWLRTVLDIFGAIGRLVCRVLEPIRCCRALARAGRRSARLHRVAPRASRPDHHARTASGTLRTDTDRRPPGIIGRTAARAPRHRHALPFETVDGGGGVRDVRHHQLPLEQPRVPRSGGGAPAAHVFVPR